MQGDVNNTPGAICMVVAKDFHPHGRSSILLSKVGFAFGSVFHSNWHQISGHFSAHFFSPCAAVVAACAHSALYGDESRRLKGSKCYEIVWILPFLTYRTPMKHAIIQSMTYKTVHSRRHEPHSIRRSGLMWAESVDIGIRRRAERRERLKITNGILQESK